MRNSDIRHRHDLGRGGPSAAGWRRPWLYWMQLGPTTKADAKSDGAGPATGT